MSVVLWVCSYWAQSAGGGGRESLLSCHVGVVLVQVEGKYLVVWVLLSCGCGPGGDGSGMVTYAFFLLSSVLLEVAMKSFVYYHSYCTLMTQNKR